MKGCGIDFKRVKRRKKGKYNEGSLSPLKKLARQGGLIENVCVFIIDNKMDDKYAYYASQAVYGSGVHHDYLTSNGYSLDPSFSDKKTRVYSKDGNAIIAYKGTGLSVVDWDADAAIAIGTQKRNPEFIKASNLAKNVKEKYGNVLVTGHSLGGTKAIESANDIGAQAIVFNPGTGLSKLKTGDHKVYAKHQDPISTRIDGMNVVWTDGGHSLDEYKKMFEPRVTGSAPMYKTHTPRMSGIRRGVGKKTGWRI
jgi:hypothetical protein